MKNVISSGKEGIKTFFKLINSIINKDIYDYDIETIKNMSALFLNNNDSVLVHNRIDNHWYWPTKLNITIVVNNEPNVFTFRKKKEQDFVGISVIEG